MSSSQRPQAATKSRLARLRHACGATQDSRRLDKYVSNDPGRIRYAYGVRHVSRRLVAVYVLLTASFQQDRCVPFPAGDPPAGSVLCRTYDIHLEQRARVFFNIKKHGVFASWPSHSAVSAKNSDAPLAPRSHCILRLFSSVTRWSTARPGHFTSFSIGANPVSIPLRLCGQTEQV